jgi:hypothetical protein
MHLEVLVEEESAKAALELLLPKILGGQVSFKFHDFQGKKDLLKNLPARLRAYRKSMTAERRIVVLVDRDREDCRSLKRRLEEIARGVGFFTKSSPGPRDRFQVLNRIAVEELEAWFFGDVQAIAAAYPGVPATLDRKAKYRDPDAIRGGTWEALERILQNAGHHRAGLAKIEAARAIASRMDPNRNRSRSFRHFRDALRGLLHP